MLSYFFILLCMKRLKFFVTALFCISALIVFAQTDTASQVKIIHRSLMGTFLDGLRWGFISVLQPCLYAMFPVTVSFFLKRSNTRAHGIKNATLYSVSIIAIFTILGFLLTLISGQNTLYQISSSAIFNIFVF